LNCTVVELCVIMMGDSRSRAIVLTANAILDVARPDGDIIP